MNNSEKALPTRTITLAGKVYTVEYDLYAVTQLNACCKKNVFREGFSPTDPDQLIPFLWAGLIRHQKEQFDGEIVDGKPSEKVLASMKEISQLVPFDLFQSVLAVFMNAWIAAFPKDDGKSDGAKDGAEKK